MEVPILTTLLESIFPFYSFLRDGFPAYRPTNDLSLTLVDDINVPKDAQSEWTDGFDNVTSGLTVRNAQAKKMGSADSDSRKISLSFRLCDLPIEVALNILCIAGSQSQSTYLSLLLTCRATYKLVRDECIPFLPIRITRKNQVPPFVMWLQKNPTLALRVKHIWLLPNTSSAHFRGDAAVLFCINCCPNLISLACGARELRSWDDMHTSPGPHQAPFTCVFQHRFLKHLTVMEDCIWSLRQGSQLLDQIETLHIIGCRSSQVQFPCSAPLQSRYPNLIEASFSLPNGVAPNTEAFLSGHFMQSPKMKKVAFITRNKPGPSSVLSSSTLTSLLGPRCLLLYRQKRWTEMKMWQERSVDMGCIWKMQRYDAMQLRF
ncbi:hypothetical protein C8J55DRAFT_504618 [Lentinula edodes]|uniref:F-box domain-containing protein n=1 Tax=Lentinula lateritia TaxID=40482 RepID=A0A9W9DYE2_9AGAR|nr:hypothetical protein C8J55DRAFT_504618 [Lentinula edodes]